MCFRCRGSVGRERQLFVFVAKQPSTTAALRRGRWLRLVPGGGGGYARRPPTHLCQQEGAQTNAEHQQRIRRSAWLHTQRAGRHEAVQDQDSAAGNLLHRLPDAGVSHGGPCDLRTSCLPSRHYLWETRTRASTALGRYRRRLTSRGESLNQPFQERIHYKGFPKKIYSEEKSKTNNGKTINQIQL